MTDKENTTSETTQSAAKSTWVKPELKVVGEGEIDGKFYNPSERLLGGGTPIGTS